MRRTPTLAAALLSLAASLPAGAQPADSFGLKQGFYILEGTSCRQASNGALSRYDGHGFSSAQVSCRLGKTVREGEAFVINQTCTMVPDNVRFRQTSRITPRGSDAFTLASENGTFRYRYCPDSALPAPWGTAR